MVRSLMYQYKMIQVRYVRFKPIKHDKRIRDELEARFGLESN